MLDQFKVFGTSIRPNKLRIFLRILKDYHNILTNTFSDTSRYYRYSSTFYFFNNKSLKSRITARAHEIEKGLSLKSPRLRFGGERLADLNILINEYIDRFGIDSSLALPAGTIRGYIKFHTEGGIEDYPLRDELAKLLERIDPMRSSCAGGVIEITSEMIREVTKVVPEDFFFRRYSIRQFTDRSVDIVDIDAAIEIALKAPAVCNRQDGFVHIVEDSELIAHMLKMQGGANGFSEQVNKLLVITNKLTNFWQSGERNQCWIDGGLFAMSLILGLHQRGLGTCCLNWSKTAREDLLMRSLLHIPDSEVIIMLLAVGHIPEQLNVAYSKRRDVNDSRSYITNWLGKPKATA
jgi:nitroreductase